MRKWAFVFAVALVAIAACTTEADRYVDATRPALDQYVGLVGEFNQLFSAGVETEAVKADAVSSLEDQVLAIEASLGKNPVPSTLSSGSKIEAVRASREEFIHATNEIKMFLSRFKETTSRFEQFEELFAKAKSELAALKEGPDLKGEALDAAYNNFAVKYQLVYKHELKNQETRIQQLRKRSGTFIEANEAFKGNTQSLYGVALPDPIPIDVSPFLSRLETWKTRLESLNAIATTEDFGRVYKTLELE